jgi:hypothetical protein
MASKDEAKVRTLAASVGIRIPMSDTTSAIFYPDELPEDHIELTDVLMGFFAPIKVWRACAVSV